LHRVHSSLEKIGAVLLTEAKKKTLPISSTARIWKNEAPLQRARDKERKKERRREKEKREKEEEIHQNDTIMISLNRSLAIHALR